MSYPTGYTITNNYNSYGHLISVTGPGGGYLWRAISDDERGNITEFKLGTQVDSIRTYNPQRGWLSSIVSTKISSGASPQDLRYTDIPSTRSGISAIAAITSLAPRP